MRAFYWHNVGARWRLEGTPLRTHVFNKKLKLNLDLLLGRLQGTTWNLQRTNVPIPVSFLNTTVSAPNSVALSRRANSTDSATATCRRNLVPTLVDIWVSRGQRRGSPTVFNLSCLYRSRYFSFKSLLIYSYKGWVDPVPDPLLLRKSGSAGNRTQDLWVSSQKLWLLDHRGGLLRSDHSEKLKSDSF
jgi:hypothetical protein